MLHRRGRDKWCQKCYSRDISGVRNSIVGISGVRNVIVGITGLLNFFYGNYIRLVDYIKILHQIK
jgi:hypothetical protein